MFVEWIERALYSETVNIRTRIRDIGYFHSVT